MTYVGLNIFVLKSKRQAVAKITCVGLDCKEELSEDFILLHINGNSALIKKYHKFLDRAQIIKDPFTVDTSVL